MRRASRRDGNHQAVVARFRALGCTVFETDRVGEGFPDIVVGCLGSNRLVEIKNPASRYGKAGLNEAQLRFNRDWRGDGLWVVTSEDEATAIVQNWRRGAVA